MRKPERQTRRVHLVAFEGCQVLDVTGPLETLSMANDACGWPAYALTLIAPRAGRLRTSGPLGLHAERAFDSVTNRELASLDSLMVAGGAGVQAALADRDLIAFLQRAAARARRVVSICSGAYLLAAAGVLSGRRATTHWSAAEDLARRYPDVRVEADAIYVRDGEIWTSAGITAGIDLTLALIEADLGREISRAVARRLVVYMRRPGGQAQFSALLKAEPPAESRLADLVAWIAENPTDDLSVEALAARAAMSSRTFARRFVAETGVTPAKFVEMSRLDHARRRLEASSGGLERVAAAAGFASAEILRRSFHRQLGLTPSQYRARFQSALRAQPQENPP